MNRDTLVPNRPASFWILVFAAQCLSIIFISLELWLPLLFACALLLIIFSPYDLIPLISLLILSLFIGYYIVEEPIGIRIVDILISISVISYILYKAFRGDLSLMKSPLDKQIFIFIIGISFSLIGAQLFVNGIINLLRHLELFAIFYIIMDIVFSKGKAAIKNLLDYYVYIATCASILAITMLYFSNESRAFGVTGSPLSDLIVSALIITISQIYIRQSLSLRLKYSFLSFILFVQIIMTQTRGAWLSLLLAILFLILLLQLASISSIVKHTVWVSLLLFLAILTSSTIFSNEFMGILHRVEHLQQLNVGTLHYRIILWEAGINTFLSHYINGIGIGHFPLLSGDFSSIGNSTFFLENIKGLTTHNIIISYLSETGLIGILCLLLFFRSVFLLGNKIYVISDCLADYQLSIPLFCILFFVCISSFYAGAWFWSINGVQFMFFLSLSAIIAKHNEA